MDFRWNPTEKQRELFEEWRKFTIGYLVTCKEGTNIRQIPSFLEEHVGEEVPYQKMGFKSINLFLYAMNECIEVRKIDFKLFIFIRESAVPSNLLHVRQLVNGQAKDKGCKTKTGVIKRPTKAQSMYCRAEELLSASQYRPPSASSTFTYGVNHRPVVVPQSSYGRRPPSRGSYAGSRPSNFSAQRPIVRSTQIPPRLQTQNRSNLTTSTSRPSSYGAPVVRRPVQPTSSSSSAAATYVYQPPKSSFSGKENVPTAADSCSTPATSSRTITAGATSAYASSQDRGPIRQRYIPGLVDDNDDDFGYSDDSDYDGFEYCGGPVKKQSKESDKFETVTVKLASSTPSVVKASQPATASSTSSTTAATTETSAQAKFVSMTPAPKKVEAATPISRGNGTSTLSTGTGGGTQSTFSVPSNVPSAPKPVTVTSNGLSAPSQVTVASKVISVPKPANLPATTEATPAKRQSSGAKPIRTIYLDSENTIHQQDVLKSGTIRIMLNFPKITFPAFFRGGSVKANMSLKSYLAGLGKC